MHSLYLKQLKNRSANMPYPRRFAYDGLIHERARLGVLTARVAHPKGLRFGDLKQLCALTGGNLSRHLQVLQAPRLVESAVSTIAPQTLCRITSKGRKLYVDHMATLEQVVFDAGAAGGEGSRSRTRDFVCALTLHSKVNG